MLIHRFIPYVWAVGVLILLTVIYGSLTRDWKLRRLLIGADGRPSTSKLQWFLWTVVVIFSYVAIYAARAKKGYYEPIDYIPYNLLVAMGLSIGTMVAAKAITSSLVSSGQLNKSSSPDKPVSSSTPANAAPPAPGPSTPSGGPTSVLKDDDGAPDLSKIQMLAWTFIAIGIYVYTVFHVVPAILNLTEHPIADKMPGLPNIDAALMVLMGLGQGAYLGKKLVTTDTSRLTGLSPSSGPAGTTVTISGLSFGEDQKGSIITIDGAPTNGSAPDWHDRQVIFAIPAKHPNSTALTAGQKLDVGLIVNGQESVNRLPFTVT